LISDEESLDSAIPEIETLIRKNWKEKRDLDLRLLIITPRQWLRVYNGDMRLNHEIIEFGSIEKLGTGREMRGDILAFFSRLEGLVREMIQARISGLYLSSAKAEEFDEILQKAGFNNCITLLKDWGMIKGKLRKKIGNLTGIRNRLAHSWDERDVFYDKKARIMLKDKIVEFREEVKEVWLELIKIHMKAEAKDIENLKVRLGGYNTIPAYNDIKESESRRVTDEE
jgi:hypothetical protein